MASDEIGKGGDIISREQAIAALDSVGDDEIETYREGSVDENAAVQACLQALRSLPAIALDAVEAEYRDAAVALAEARRAYLDAESGKTLTAYMDAATRFDVAGDAYAARDAR